jgi:hypothetical protein
MTTQVRVRSANNIRIIKDISDVEKVAFDLSTPRILQALKNLGMNMEEVVFL